MRYSLLLDGKVIAHGLSASEAETMRKPEMVLVRDGRGLNPFPPLTQIRPIERKSL